MPLNQLKSGIDISHDNVLFGITARLTFLMSSNKDTNAKCNTDFCPEGVTKLQLYTRLNVINLIEQHTPRLVF